MPINLVVGTNSYLSIADAEEYFTTRIRSDSWYGATEDEKAQALITATRQIDRLALRGTKKLSSQALAFPRYPNTEVSQRVKDAICEEGFAILKGVTKRIELQQQGVKQAQVGNIMEIYSGKKIKLISPEARELLRPYMIGSVRIT